MCRTKGEERGQAEINPSKDFSRLSRRMSDCRKSDFQEDVWEKEDTAEDREAIVGIS